MNRLVSSVATALALLPAVAAADPLLSFGPDIPLFITASASVRREANVLLTAQSRQADTIYVLVPGTDFRWTGGKASLGIAFSEQFSRYASNRALNSHLANLAGNFGYAGSNSSLAAAASFQQQDQSSLTAASSQQTVRHSQANASLNGEVTVAPKTSLGLGGSFGRTIYPEVGFINTDTWSFPANLYYALTPKTDVSLGFVHDRTLLATGTGDSSDNFYNVGARGDFTAKLSGSFRVGVTNYTRRVGPGSRDLGLSANLNYLFSPKTSLAVTANRGFAASPLGTGEKDFTVGLSSHTQLSEAWSISLGGSFQSTDYLINPGRTDDFWVGNAGLSYALTQATSMELSYVYRTNRSTLAPAAFNDDVLTFTASTRF